MRGHPHKGRLDERRREGGMRTEKVTIHTLRQKKAAGEKLTMLTCYDATFARLLDDGGVDILLVGDSLGMVVQGNSTTLPVTLDEMIYHTRAVVRGTRYHSGNGGSWPSGDETPVCSTSGVTPTFSATGIPCSV